MSNYVAIQNLESPNCNYGILVQDKLLYGAHECIWRQIIMEPSQHTVICTSMHANTHTTITQPNYSSIKILAFKNDKALSKLSFLKTITHLYVAKFFWYYDTSAIFFKNLAFIDAFLKYSITIAPTTQLVSLRFVNQVLL